MEGREVESRCAEVGRHCLHNFGIVRSFIEFRFVSFRFVLFKCVSLSV